MIKKILVKIILAVALVVFFSIIIPNPVSAEKIKTETTGMPTFNPDSPDVYKYEPNTAAPTSGGKIPMPEATPSNVPTDAGVVTRFIGKVFNIIITIGEVAFIIMLLVGGVMYITSGASEGQAEKAKKLIINAGIGVVILLAAWGIASWILLYFK